MPACISDGEDVLSGVPAGVGDGEYVLGGVPVHFYHLWFRFHILEGSIRIFYFLMELVL